MTATIGGIGGAMSFIGAKTGIATEGIIGEIGIGTIAAMSAAGTIMVEIMVGLMKAAGPGDVTRAMLGIAMVGINGFVTTETGTVSMVGLVLENLTGAMGATGTTAITTSRSPCEIGPKWRRTQREVVANACNALTRTLVHARGP
ncbi:MAG: hypothetical protein KGO02_01740 [Alphaproteobacteria bacterium]|nr:hypothetical protein [Alphaproteobacteria bacterium]